MGVPVQTLNKLGDGSPHVVDEIERGAVDLVINTPVGTGARTDGYEIRRAAIARGIPCITTLSGGMAAARAIASARAGRTAPVLSLQELHGGATRARVEAACQAPVAPSCRAGEVTAPTRLLACRDDDRPAPRPVLHARAAVERWGGGDGERPFLPRAFSYLAPRRGRPRVPAGGRRPGHASPVLAGRGRRAVGARPARQRLRPRDGARRCLVGGGIGIVPLAVLAGPRLGGAGPARLSATPPMRRRPRCMAARSRWPPTTGRAGHAGLVTELLARADRDGDRTVYACGPPPMLEAVRALCAERGVPGPARARVRHGLRLRRLLRLRGPDPRRLRAPVPRRPGPRRAAALEAVA